MKWHIELQHIQKLLYWLAGFLSARHKLDSALSYFQSTSQNKILSWRNYKLKRRLVSKIHSTSEYFAIYYNKDSTQAFDPLNTPFTSEQLLKEWVVESVPV